MKILIIWLLPLSFTSTCKHIYVTLHNKGLGKSSICTPSKIILNHVNRSSFLCLIVLYSILDDFREGTWNSFQGRKVAKIAFLVLNISKKTTNSPLKWQIIYLHTISRSSFMAILGCGHTYIFGNKIQLLIIFLIRLNCVCSMFVVCGILQNWSLYPHTLMYSHRTWTQWSLGRVTHVTLTDVVSKVI